MLFMAVLKHSPENCFARPENVKADEEVRKILRKMVQGKEEIEKETGVKVIGSYLNPNEHVFYFIFETSNYGGVHRFLSGPLITHHEAKITPVLALDQIPSLKSG